MGQRITALALADSEWSVAGAIEFSGHPSLGQDLGVLLGLKALGVRVTDDARAAMQAGEVVIEFTQPEATVAHVRLAATLRKPIVVGTTGLSEAQRATVADAAKTIPLLLSPNMSLGVNVLFELVEATAKRLGMIYDVEVIEAHHRTKKDAPSGTAKRLVEGLAKARRQPSDQIPVHAIRAGDIVGDHTVIFAGSAERLELTHRASSRDVFAKGALAAAQFLRMQPAGLYDMSHVIAALSSR